MIRKSIYAGWIISSILLFLYSFTQVDLSLTLSRIPIGNQVIKSFQFIGYFQRPLSSALYLFVIVLLFSLYLFTLKLVKNGQLKRRDIWKIIIAVGIILTLSYNAFSYDLFNYIFDARIVTHYGLNPYQQKALDFPGDPMLSFMHWTHRIYPYGPFWLILTIPLSYLGFGYFLPTLYLFKILALFNYLGIVYFIEKILKKIRPQDMLLGMVFFAFNPLVLIEALVSAHNDIAMLFFSVLSLYLFFGKKYILSFIIFILSVGIKFATVILLPVYAIFFIKRKFKNFNNDITFDFSIILMTIAVVLASNRTNYQPWYLLLILPYASFVSSKYFIFIPSLIFSLFSLLQYIPFLYLGNWNAPVPEILAQLNYSAVVVSAAVTALWFVKKRINREV